MKTSLHTSIVRRFSVGIALSVVLFVTGHSRPARAELVSGLQAAFTVDALIGGGSIVSIIGNSVDLARKKPHRAWMYSGFILGSINTAIGVLVAPIILATSGAQPVAYGAENMCEDRSTKTATTDAQLYPCGPNRLDVALGMTVAHSVVGLTNIALAVRNAMLYRRLGLAGEGPQPPPPVLSSLRVAPVISRDLTGAPMYGAVVSLSGF